MATATFIEKNPAQTNAVAEKDPASQKAIPEPKYIAGAVTVPNNHRQQLQQGYRPTARPELNDTPVFRLDDPEGGISQLKKEFGKTVYKDPVELQKSLEVLLKTFEEAHDSKTEFDQQKAASNLYKFIVDNKERSAGPDQALGCCLITAYQNSWGPARKDREGFEKRLKAALEVEEKRAGVEEGTYFEEYYNKKIKDAVYKENRHLSNMLDTKTREEVLVLQSLEASKGAESPPAFIRDLVRNGAGYFTDKEFRTGILQKAATNGFDPKSLPDSYKPIYEELKGIPDKESFGRLGASIDKVLTGNLIKDKKGQDEFAALLEAMFDNPNLARILAGYISAVDRRLAASKGEKLPDEQASVKNVQDALTRLAKDSADKGLTTVAQKINDIQAKPSSLYFGRLNQCLSHKLPSEVGVAIVELVSQPNPQEFMRSILTNGTEGKETILQLIDKMPPQVQPILRAAEENNMAKVQAEALIWSIREKQPEYFRLMHKLADSEALQSALKESTTVTKSDKGTPFEINNEQKGKNFVEWEKSIKNMGIFEKDAEIRTFLGSVQ